MGFTLLCLYGVVVARGVVFDSRVVMWVLMEISLYLLIMFMLLNGVNISSLVLYYVVQTIGSCFILWGWLVCPAVGWVGLFLKLGVFPFSVWVLKCVRERDKKSVVVLILGFQKLLPICFIVKIILVPGLVVLLSLFRCLFGVFVMLQSNSFNLLISGSSVIHTSWVVLYF